MRISSLTTALCLLGLFLVTVPPVSVRAEDADAAAEEEGDNNDGNDNNNANDEGEGGEDGNDQQADDGENDDAQQNYNYNDNNGGGNDDWNAIQAEYSYAGDDYIKYWDNHAVLPKSCVTLGGQDVVVFSVYENGFKQCSNDPLGTYYVPVPYFLQAYLQQLQSNQIDMGNDDYELPAESAYSECTNKAVGGVDYYVMAGCDDTDRHKLAVNIYSDNTCETPSKDAVSGMDDADIDISDIQIPFQQCQQCVIWMDVNDDEVDDKYYENKQINAPLCSKAWSLKEKCGMKCKRLSKESSARDGWNGEDAILLLVMSAFAGGMLAAIVKKRRKIEEKVNCLLTDPTGDQFEKRTAAVEAISTKTLYMAFGAMFGLFVICALFAAKKMTWFLIICLNVALFGYLLKLVVDYSAMVDDDDEEETEDDDDDDDDSALDLEKPQMT